MGSMNMPYSYLVTAAARCAPSIVTLTGSAARAAVAPLIAQPRQAANINLERI
jgi:hypothetical protein